MNTKTMEKRVSLLEERLAPRRPEVELRKISPEEWRALAVLRHVVRRRPGAPPELHDSRRHLTEQEWEQTQKFLAQRRRGVSPPGSAL